MMKPVVAIALIIAGVALVALPPITDAAMRSDLIHLIGTRGFTNASLPGLMDPIYRAGCYVAGVACIGVAIRYSTARRPGKGPARVDEIA